MDEIVFVKQMWTGYRRVLDRAPGEAQISPTFHQWVGHNYGQTLGSAVRRQVEARDDVISLGRLLNLLAQYPRLVSRERFVRFHPEHETEDETAVRFDEFNESNGAFLDRGVPTSNLNQLRSDTQKVCTWVNKSVAHWDPEREKFFEGITFDEIHAAVDAVIKEFVRWYGFMCGAHLDTDIVLLPWERIFRVPWAPHLEHPFGSLGDASAAPPMP